MKAALVISGLVGLLGLAGCAAGPIPTSPIVHTATPTSMASPTATSSSQTPLQTASPTPEPIDSGGSTTGGDIPDNAVFLTYRDGSHGFSIEYVEGWQVTPTIEGVLIRDKDSSETVTVVAPVTDIPAYISSTDLPSLQGLPGYTFVSQDTVKVGGVQLNHVVYHAASPPDPVTGKEVPSTIDRYYIPGSAGLAIVTLSTPDGVDNVDAFRTMIGSFNWS